MTQQLKFPLEFPSIDKIICEEAILAVVFQEHAHMSLVRYALVDFGKRFYGSGEQ